MGRLRAGFALGLVFALCAAMSGLASSAGAASIAYPDLRVIVPPQDISISQLSPTEKMLAFTHITWDAGAGPLEIRPSYNPVTGISQGYQALYSSPSPGVWTFDHTVPIVGPLVRVPLPGFRFPLDTFGLYTVAANGGLGTLLAPSPKTEFCMDANTYVGGVPNAPLTNEYPPTCSSPEGRLGLGVGWGDQYESTDVGEDINIAAVPNATYWLRAQADPYHYFAESSASDKITDTKIQIEGTTVKVLEQTHPSSTPPTVTLTSPSEGAVASGNLTVSATASGPAPVTSVQFLLDGQPLGSPVTSPPYTAAWDPVSASPGTHYLSAQATDANRFVGTAPAVGVTVPKQVGTFAITATVSAANRSEPTTPQFSTSSPDEFLLAFAGSDGPSAGGQTLSVSGAGLTWKLVKRENAQAGDAEIWAATASSPLSGATVTAKATTAGFDQSLTVLALSGASGVGKSAGANASSGEPAVSLAAAKAGSLFFATGNDWNNAIARTLGAGQVLLSENRDTRTRDTYWTQYLEAPSATAGQAVTLNDTAPTTDRWNLAAVEVLASEPPSPPAPEPPLVSMANPLTGQAVSGQIPVSASVSDNVAVSSVQFSVDGKPLGSAVTNAPYATTWDTTTATNGAHTLTATATNSAGQTGSSSVEVKVQNPAEPGPCFVVDANVTANGRGTATTPSFITAETGEQLLALVSADGPNRAQGQTVTVSGAGLTWHPVARANSQSGDAEIWWATAPTALSGATVTSTPAVGGYGQSLSVIAVQMSNGIGASTSGGAASGMPSVSLKTQEAGSLVFAVGHDWDKAIERTLGPNQVMLHQFLDMKTGDTSWSQYTSQVIGLAGTEVTLNDVAPTGDRWDMAAVELRGDGLGV
jgi:hypothetical protein